jgi:hypothetical protein
MGEKKSGVVPATKETTRAEENEDFILHTLCSIHP